MRKIFGVSFVAILAATPLMANAAGERTVVPLNATAPLTASSELASTTYVQGAFATTADAIDGLIADTAAANGEYVKSGKTVAANLAALDSQVELNAAAAAANALAIGDASSGLTQKINTAESTLNTLTGEGPGSITKQIESAISSVNSATEGLDDRVTSNTTNIGTNTNAINEIKSKQIKYVDTWPNGATKTMAIDDLDDPENDG